MQFDARAAKLLQPGQHLTVDDAPGLRLVRSSVGHSWIYRFKSPVDDRMRQVKLGAWPAMSAAAAAAAWEAKRAERSSGADPAKLRRAARQAEKAQTAGIRTVGELLDAFVAQALKHRAEKGREEIKRQLVTMTAPIRSKTPAEVTRSVAYDLIDSYRDTPVVASQLRRNLGAAWEWGHDSGKVSEEVPNWWRQILRGKLASRGKIVKGKHTGVGKRVLSAPEVGAVLRHLPHISQQMGELLTLYLWTGCRGDELVQIEGSEVTKEADGWWWTCPRDKLKMAHNPLTTDLRVPLIGRAQDIVLARKDVYGDGHLFPSTNRRAKLPHVTQKSIGVEVWTHMPGNNKRVERKLHVWPVLNWAPHDLRRTVRTQLAALGCESTVAEAVIGHIAAGVEGTYNRHHYDKERREWLTRLASSWEAAAEAR